jgi:lipopolysaccharide export system permease protein
MSDYPQSYEQKSKPRKPVAAGAIFRRALVREMAGMGVLIFTILLGIMVLSMLIRLLGEAVAGALAEEGVITMMGFVTLNYLPALLSISLFMSVLLTLTRSYRDSEMVVWFCAGLSLAYWIRPVLRYVLPAVALIALLSLVISPWANFQAQEYKQRLSHRDDVSAARPGVFREASGGERVYFIESVDAEQRRVSNVFVQLTQNGKMGTVAAKEGTQEIMPNGDRFLVLLNGTRYEGVPGQRDFRIARFERYAMRIEEQVEDPNSIKPLQAVSSLALLQQPNTYNIAEFEWRLGIPLSALTLALLAIPLSFVNPRAGRSLNLIMAAFLYMIYNNVNNVVNASVAQGKIGMVAGFLLVHLAMFGLMVVLFRSRLMLFSLRRLKR